MPAAALTATHVKVPSGDSASSYADMRGRIVVAVETPTGFDSANFFFKVGDKPVAEGGTLRFVYYIDDFTVPGTFTPALLGIDAQTSAHIDLAGVLPQGFGNGIVQITTSGVESADREFVLYSRPV